MKLKAYNVRNEECGMIVFHETPGKAKALALDTNEWYEDSEYIQLTAKREPKADIKAGQIPSILNFCENADFYVYLDWYCISEFDCDKKECTMMGRIAMHL